MLGFSDIQKDQSLDLEEELFDNKSPKQKDLSNNPKNTQSKPDQINQNNQLNDLLHIAKEQ